MSSLAFQAKPLSRRAIRQIAGRFRSLLGYEEHEYVVIDELLDLVMPRVLPQFCYEVRELEEMGEAHGLADPDNFHVIFRSDVYEQACRGQGRDRLTVIHEIGHLILHPKERILLARGTGRPNPNRMRILNGKRTALLENSCCPSALQRK